MFPHIQSMVSVQIGLQHFLFYLGSTFLVIPYFGISSNSSTQSIRSCSSGLKFFNFILTVSVELVPQKRTLYTHSKACTGFKEGHPSAETMPNQTLELDAALWLLRSNWIIKSMPLWKTGFKLWWSPLHHFCYGFLITLYVFHTFRSLH